MVFSKLVTNMPEHARAIIDIDPFGRGERDVTSLKNAARVITQQRFIDAGRADSEEITQLETQALRARNQGDLAGANKLLSKARHIWGVVCDAVFLYTPPQRD